MNSIFVVICFMIQNGGSSDVKTFNYEIETGEELSPPIYFAYYKGDNLTMYIYLKNRAKNIFATLSVTSLSGNFAKKESFNAVNESYFIVDRQLTNDIITIDLGLSTNNSCSCSTRISEGRLASGTTNSSVYEYSGICSIEFCYIVVDVKKQCIDAEGKSCLNSVAAYNPTKALLLLLVILIIM